MTVQCPRCGTQYRIPDSRINDSRPVFKCTRCSLVFSRDTERPGRAGGRGREESAERNLHLDFELGTPAEPPATTADPTRVNRPAGPPETPPRAQMTASSSRVSPRPTRQYSSPHEIVVERGEHDLELAPEPDLTIDDDLEMETELGADQVELEEESPVLIAAPPERTRTPINPRRRAQRSKNGRSPIRPVAVAVGTVSFAFLILALLLNARPRAALDALSEVPLLGRLLGDDHLLTWRVQLADLEGGYDQIKGDRRAYVVSGRVINSSSQNVRLIEIEGKLLAAGTERRRQLVYAANQFRKTIRDLSPSEVEMLLRLEPNRRFLIRPGESASFLLVFPDPPNDISEVACRVLSVRAA